MKKKLRSSRGFTLSELLTAVAILALLSTAVAVGMPVAMRVYRQVTVRSEASVLCNTISTALADELRQAISPDASDDSFYSGNFSGRLTVNSKDEDGDEDGRVYLGTHPLLSDAAYSDAKYSSTAYTGGLRASAEAKYDGKLFKVKVQVFKQGDESEALSAAEFTIAPLNP